MSLTAILITIFVYLALLFATSWWAGRRATNRTFFTGNRENPWWVAALAMVGAAMSGVTFVSVPGSVAADSFSYMQMVAGFAVGQLVVAYVLVPLFYRLRVTSLYEYLGGRFGDTTHRTGAWIFFAAKMLGASLRVLLVCTVFQALVFDPLGVSFAVNAGIVVGLVWLYTRRGGVRTVVWTDVLHTLCLVAAIVLTICYLQPSLTAMVEVVHESSMSRIFFFDDPASGRYFWKMFFGGVFVLIGMTGLDQDMMQRNLSCRTPRESQINIVITAVTQSIVIFLLLALGVLLYDYAARTGLPLPAKSDQLFGLVAVNGGLPLVVGAVFVAGLISSTASSAGASLTALTTSFTVDILRREKSTSTRRWVHVAMAVAMAAVVVVFGAWGDESVINLVFRVAGYTYGPILGMFTFGIVTRRRIRERWLPVVVVAAPALSWVMQHVLSQRFGYVVGFELIAYNALFTIVGMWIISKKQHR